MSLFGLRFDFRNPDFAGTTMAERYEAALDMAEWADRLGFVIIVLSEHHGSDDGYLPSPLAMAAAIAARTEQARIRIAALIAPFHDPLRVAEDVAVVDLLSNGRLDLVVANGYVPGEFAMFGCELSDRVRRTTETVATLRQAWTGEPFEFRGRTVQIRPTPAQPGGPPIVLGGSGPKAARRAARIADGFMPSDGSIWDVYREEMLALGKPDPGPFVGGDTSAFHLAHDVEQGWEQYAPFAPARDERLRAMDGLGRHRTRRWVRHHGRYRGAARTGQYRVLTPDDLVAEIREKGEYGFTLFHPLVGGVPPAMGWESLHLFEHEVLPRLTAS